MPFDYLADFPIPVSELPAQLRDLLTPEGMSPSARVVVAARQDLARETGQREFLQMVTALIPNGAPEAVPSPRAGSDGLVAHSTPVANLEGDLADYAPSLSGNDYVVAAWGDNSFFSYHLAEKVWMALGLSARCVGSDRQRLVYDDLSIPEFGVAEGDVSTEYEWTLKRDVVWTMTNARLRQYLWMRGATAARTFFYEVLLPDSAGLRAVMGGQKHFQVEPKQGWYVVDLREFDGGLLLQVWATVVAVTSERCAEATADGLVWPGYGAITANAANALVAVTPVFLDDAFLERYEQNGAYDTTPVWVGHERWHCSPSYRGQWSFSQCVRVGRNLVRVPMRELYKPKPDGEIVHAHRFALDPQIVAQHDPDEEHVVAKTQRLLDAFLNLADGLSELGRLVGLVETAFDLCKISRVELRANGWKAYPQLERLAQVAPLAMTQQAFLARCKSLHEFSQGIPNGYMKKLLVAAGAPRDKVKELGSLKLLQALLNVLESLNNESERVDAFASTVPPEGWDTRNEGLLGLFVANDLRIADAHEVQGKLGRLEALGFDLAELNAGYGTALDRVFDRVIDAFVLIEGEIEALLQR